MKTIPRGCWPLEPKHFFKRDLVTLVDRIRHILWYDADIFAWNARKSHFYPEVSLEKIMRTMEAVGLKPKSADDEDLK